MIDLTAIPQATFQRRDHQSQTSPTPVSGAEMLKFMTYLLKNKDCYPNEDGGVSCYHDNDVDKLVKAEFKLDEKRRPIEFIISAGNYDSQEVVETTTIKYL
jgi:hypothetical protein